jgi:uncharacterized protein (TIGR00369 family)
MNPIWKQPVSVEILSALQRDTGSAHVGIEILEVGDDFVRGRMPVDARTRQPYGLLHGGMTAVLADTLASLGAAYACPPGQRVVGLELNASHLRGVRSGWVAGLARPLRLGRSTHVWQIELSDEAGRLTCVSRLTLAVLEAGG